MRNLLSNAALAQLAVFNRSAQIDSTEELFAETYELIANNVSVQVREDEDKMHDAVMQQIAAF
jgi:hypothetical protein